MQFFLVELELCVKDVPKVLSAPQRVIEERAVAASLQSILILFLGTTWMIILKYSPRFLDLCEILQ